MGIDENTPMEPTEGSGPEPADEESAAEVPGPVEEPPAAPEEPPAAPPAAEPPAWSAPPPPPPPPAAPMPPPVPAPVAPGAQQKDKTVAGILGILLGSFGVHKFYLGYNNEGFIMLGVSLGGYILGTIGSIIVVGACLYIAPAVMGVIGLVEGIMYLTKTDEDFYNTYVAGKKAWF